MTAYARLDFDQINSAALRQLPSLVREWCPDGNMSGHEWVALNPVRGDKHLGSFKINTATGVWRDFADDQGGSDPVSLYAYLFTDDNQAAAARELGRQVGVVANDNERPALRPVTPKDARPAKAAAEDETPETVPVPDDAPEPPDSFPRKQGGEWLRMPVVARWPYRDAEGRLLGYACRIQPSVPDKPDSKDVLICRWLPRRRDGMGWGWKSFHKPRPLQGLDDLAARPGANVLIVEGEKTREAAARLYPDLVAVTWPGGTKAIHHVDWSPLAGRKVLLWPDADAPGFGAVEGHYDRHGRWRPGIDEMLPEGVQGVRVVVPPHDVPEGWDLADAEDWDQATAWDYLTGNLREPRKPAPAEPEPLPPAPTDDTPQPGDQTDPANWPFRMLGHDGDLYYYLDDEGLRVRALTSSAHTKGNLVALADLQWWASMWPARDGADWDMAQNALMRYQHRVGIYDPSNVRGRGAWYDNGQTVIHLGDQLLVDGTPTRIHEHRTRYIYEAGVRHDMTAGQEPLDRDQVQELREFLRLLSWELPVSADLLLGFCVGGVVCGALPWRPHIWITGRSGSGKSWVYDHVLRELFGDWALRGQSNTTEAGLRQSLGLDSRPVLFDEAEAEDKQSQARMKAVLELMRQASSEGGAPILKGTATGKAQEFHVRSCFAFSSINTSASQAADISRISVLQLVRNTATDADEKFDAIKRRWAELFTPEFTGAFRAAAADKVQLIRRVQETFARAGAEYFGKRRDGDQYGTLLACAWALQADDDAELTLDDARAIFRGYDWGDAAGLSDEDEDEMRCMTRLLQASIRTEVTDPHNGRGAVYTRTVGELVQVAAGLDRDAEDGNLNARTADHNLRRHGLGVHGNLLAVSNTHTWIARQFESTPWAANWAPLLVRLPGAERRRSFRFAGAQNAAVVVPVNSLSVEGAAPETDDPPF